MKEPTLHTKGKGGAALFLLLLAPALGEIMSGSSPPLEFISPGLFVLNVILYGGGALLIREAKVRWKLGWSVIFLAVAYGILEEGLIVQSFFNNTHEDLQELSDYGLFLKTQWSWALLLIMFHATVSTLLPILVTDMLWPRLKTTSFLNKPGIVIFIVLLILEMLLFNFGFLYNRMENPDAYAPDYLLLMVWTIITAALIYLAYKFKNSRRIENINKLRSPFVFALLALLFQLINLLAAYVMASIGVSAIVTIAVQLCLAVLVLLFVFRQIYHAGITTGHKSALVFGTVFAYVLLSPIYEFSNKQPWSLAAGITAFALLVLFMIKVNRKKSETHVKQPDSVT